MKHLLRAMGAAMLAALLLSACSTPQEQTEPSAPQTTQATQAATGATEESATEAEELLALPRDLGSGLTLQTVLPFSGPNVDADGAESDQLATIIVQNDGGMAVGAADITLTCEDGRGAPLPRDGPARWRLVLRLRAEFRAVHRARTASARPRRRSSRTARSPWTTASA